VVHFARPIHLNKKVKTSELKTIDDFSKLKNTVKTESIDFYNDGIQLTLHPYGNGVNVHIINVQPRYQGKGIGREIMEMILSVSNDLKTPIYLIPIEMGNVSIEVLRRFYHGLGFKRESISRYWKYTPVKVISISERKQIQYRMVG
jgi:GNAT superfamily N-acetyltransferase